MDDQSAVPPVPAPAGRRRVIAIASLVAVVVLGAAVAFAVTRGNESKAAANGTASSSGLASVPTTGVGARGTGSTKPNSSAATVSPGGSRVPGSPTTARQTSGSTARPGTTPTTKRGGPTGFTVFPPQRSTGSTVPSSIATAYSAAFTARCQEIWSHAGADGQLWDAINSEYGPYTIDDCTSSLDPSWGEAMSDTVAQAHQQGIDDANSAVSDLIESNRLRNSAGYIYDLPQ